MFRTALAACAVLIAVLAMGWSARADELTEFELGRNSYAGGRYEEAVDRFTQMLDKNYPEHIVDPQLVEQARIYRVASLIAVGRLADADVEIEVILRANPGAYPDPIIFPGIVLDRFTDVRGRIRKQLEDQARRKAMQEQARLQQQEALRQQERDRVRRLELSAQQQVHIVENSRWIAAIPFGVGQFQNEQPALAWTLLIGETALATSSIVTAAIHASLQSKGHEPNVDTKDLNARLASAKLINNISFASLAAVAALGVVHAQLTYVPYRKEIKRRELPNDLKPIPAVAVTSKGAFIGVGATF